LSEALKKLDHREKKVSQVEQEKERQGWKVFDAPTLSKLFGNETRLSQD